MPIFIPSPGKGASTQLLRRLGKCLLRPGRHSGLKCLMHLEILRTKQPGPLLRWQAGEMTVLELSYAYKVCGSKGWSWWPLPERTNVGLIWIQPKRTVGGERWPRQEVHCWFQGWGGPIHKQPEDVILPLQGSTSDRPPELGYRGYIKSTREWAPNTCQT